MADPGLIRADRRAIRRWWARRLLATSVAAVIGIVALAVALMVAGDRIARDSDRALVAIAMNPAHYQSAAPDLVRLCQTNPGLLRRAGLGDVDAAQVPSIGRLNPAGGTVTVNADSASLEWTDGEHMAGWHLQRLPDLTVPAATHQWTLSFRDGRQNGPVLQTLTMPADARFTAADLAPAAAPQAGR